MAESMEKRSSILFSVMSIAAILVGIVIYFARLDPAIADLDRKVTEVKVSQTEASARVDRIEESRAIGLQRLSRAEEAVASLKDTLTKIDSKVDRLLMRR